MSRSGARRALCLAIASGLLLTLAWTASATARPHATSWWDMAGKYRKLCKPQHRWSKWHRNSTGPIFGVASTGGEPAVAASDQDCLALVVWTAAGGGVFSRIVDGDGKPVTAPVRIAATGDSPDVIYNGDKDEYLVVWSAAASSDVPRTIHAQRVGGDGRRLGPERWISSPDAEYLDLTPSVAWSDRKNEYLVVWAHTFHEFPTISVRAQRLNGNGAEIGDNDFVLDSTEYRAPSDIAVDPSSGRWFVVWETNAEGPFSFIRGRLVEPNGTLGPIVQVSSRPMPPGELEFGYADDPAVGFNSDDREYLVVWSDPNNQGTFGSDVDPKSILGQRVSASGALVGPDRFVIAPAQTVLGNLTPALDYDAKDDEYLVAWHEATDSRDDGRVVGQFIAGSGDPHGDQLQISAPGAAKLPAISFSGPAGSFLAAWQGVGPSVFDRAVR